MAGRKPKKAPAGAPEWVVTYGDMMSLLLTFFIMLVAMSEIKKDTRYQQVVESIQEVFGYRGGIGSVPNDVPPDVAPIIRRMAQADQNFKQRTGESRDEAPDGRREAVKTVRDGQTFVMGGTGAFEEGQAQLLPAVHDDLLAVAQAIRGYTLKVEIRGHTSAAPLPDGSPFGDHLDLAYARARAVRDFLVGRGGIEPHRLRLVAVGAAEPVEARAYTLPQRQRNSRVEIVMLEATVQEFEGAGEPTAMTGEEGVVRDAR